MSAPTEFLTIYCCYEDVDTVGKMLPTVLTESARTNSAVVVHDCSQNRRQDMDVLIRELKREYPFFYFHSDRISMALARNFAMSIGIELFSPGYICMIEDDHGFMPGLIPEMVFAMKQHYGLQAPSGLRYGLFTACPHCWGENYKSALIPVEKGLHSAVDISRVSNLMAGGANSCFRCAPTSHWISVLRGYDTDEYPISTFQTAGLNLRNYHKGFTALVVRNGELALRETREGRGFSTDPAKRPFNTEFAARDPRSGFRPCLGTCDPSDTDSGLPPQPAVASVSPVTANTAGDEVVRLHLGCGMERRKGWINIDVQPELRPDVLSVANHLPMFADATVDLIEANHLFEHFTYDEARAALAEWARVLRDGGELYLELPDFDACVGMLGLHADPQGFDLGMIGIFGWPPAVAQEGIPQVHKWGWTRSALSSALQQAGFDRIEFIPIQQTWRVAASTGRDMRVRALRSAPAGTGT